MADVSAKTDPSTNKVQSTHLIINTIQNFCGDSCLQKHLIANQIKCQLSSGCPRKFVKAIGHFIHGKWFCSPACAEKDPDTQKIKDMLERKERGEPLEDNDEDDMDLDGETGDVDL